MFVHTWCRCKTFLLETKTSRECGRIWAFDIETGAAISIFYGIYPWTHIESRQVAIAAYGLLQLTLLVLWALNSYSPQTAVPAAALELCAVLLVSVLSYVEHKKSIRPSSLIQTYLLFSILFDITEIRSVWFIPGYRAVAGTLIAAILIKATIVLLEAGDKVQSSQPVQKKTSPEEISSIFGQSTFFWLNPLLIKGSRKVLSDNDLYPLANDVNVDSLGPRFQEAWNSVKSTNKQHKLLRALYRTLKWPLLAPVIPRFALMGFTFCQPFLINSLLDYLQRSPSGPKDYGYGFIGAAVIIYLGISISTGLYWYRHNRFLVMIRGCFVSAVYRKTCYISVTAEKDAAITLMSTDIDKIVEA